MQTHRLFCCSKAASPSLSNVVMWTLRAQSQYLSLPWSSCNSSLQLPQLFFAASGTLPCGIRNFSLQLPQFAVGSLLPQKYLWALLLPTVQQNCSVVGTVPFQKAISQGVLPTTKCRKIPHTYQGVQPPQIAGKCSLRQKQAPQPSLKAAGPARLNLT